jgi:hypothetical protein
VAISIKRGYPITLAVPAADRPAFVAALAGTTIPQLNPLQNLDLNLPFLYRQGFHNPTWKALVITSAVLPRTHGKSINV